LTSGFEGLALDALRNACPKQEQKQKQLQGFEGGLVVLQVGWTKYRLQSIPHYYEGQRCLTVINSAYVCLQVLGGRKSKYGRIY
jgi:hypothetical protein